MNKGMPRAFMPIALVLLLAIQFLVPVMAEYEAKAKIQSKSEVIYTKLDAQGEEQGVYVVNGFNVKKGGRLTDYGDYAEVFNLTSTNELEVNGDSISVDADEGNFYYQGNLDNAVLPWNIAISYILDGKNIPPEELGGESGDLEIHISVTNNKAANQIFYDNYMMQISLTLNPDICLDIEAGDGTLANSGTNRIIAFTLMPGKDAEFVLKTTVTDFTMPAMEISAVPFGMSFDLPDTGDMMSEMVLLSDALIQLNDGVGKISNGMTELSGGVGAFADGMAGLYEGTGELKDGTQQLSDGAALVAGGSAAYNAGMKQLSSGAGGLEAGSSQINDGLKQILEAIDPSCLEGLENIDLSILSQLPEAFYSLADELDTISYALNYLTADSSNALNILDNAVASIPDYTISQDSIDTLWAISDADPSLEGVVEHLLAFYSGGKAVKQAYSGIRPSLETIAAYSPELGNDLKAMSENIRTTAKNLESALSEAGGLADIGKISQILEYFNEFVDKYGEFHDGLSQLAGGLSEASSAYSLIHMGVVGIADGTAELAEGTAELHDGVGELVSGAQELHSGTESMADGMKELHSGTRELADAVSDLPDEIEVQIDELMGDYDKSDFTPESFVSSKNRNVSYVQFVFMTDAIEKESQDDLNPETPENETLWDRFLALFGF